MLVSFILWKYIQKRLQILTLSDLCLAVEKEFFREVLVLDTQKTKKKAASHW